MKRLYFFLFIACLSVPVWGKLTATQFPKTIDDLSFESRTDLKAEGYKPFLDAKAYAELNIVPGEEYFTDHLILSELKQERQQKYDAEHMTREEYCKKYPYDEQMCPQETSQDTQTSYTSGGNCITDWTIGRKPVTPNNSVTGGACYPPDNAGKGRENRILTSGRYETISPAFEKGMITILRKEGQHCNIIQGDSGGYTCLGIAWNYNKDKFPSKEALSRITFAEAEDYYYKYFWNQYKIYMLPDVISSYYLWAAMGSGPGTAYNQFRKFLGIKSYNKALQITPEMVEAVKNYKGDIAKDWMDKVRGPFLVGAKNKYEERIPNQKMGGFLFSAKIQRENGCHVCPKNPLHRPPQPIQRKID